MAKLQCVCATHALAKPLANAGNAGNLISISTIPRCVCSHAQSSTVGCAGCIILEQIRIQQLMWIQQQMIPQLIWSDSATDIKKKQFLDVVIESSMHLSLAQCSG